MFICKFFDNLSGENVNYLYINQNNEIIGFSLNKNEFDYNTFNEIKKSLFFNEKCYKLINYKNYEVYFDPITKLKHYLREGKEDFELFFKYNGKDAIECLGKKNIPTFGKIFVVGSICIILSSYFFYPHIQTMLEYNNYKVSEYIANYDFDYNETTMYNMLENINKSQNISDADKLLLSNTELFKTIQPYYGEKITDILMRLNDITIKESTNEEDQYFANNELVEGYYNPLEPNVINLRANLSNETRNHTVIHEFIHLLQNKNNKYSFFSESVAALFADEIVGYNPSGYKDSVIVLKMLIDVIGPEPILKGCFGYDYTMLEDILADNLSLNEYEELTRSLFVLNPKDLSEQQLDKIKSYIYKIHFNLTGKNFQNDNDILYNCVYGDIIDDRQNILNRQKTYLLTSRMEDEEIFWIELEFYNNKEKLMELDLIKEVDMYQICKKLSYEEYIQQKDSSMVYISNIRKDIGEFDFKENKFVCYDSNNNPTEKLSIKEALKRCYIEIMLNDYIEIDKDLPLGFEYVTGNYGTAPLPLKKVISNSDNIYVFGDCVKITIPSIKKRFNIQNLDNLQTFSITSNIHKF